MDTSNSSPYMRKTMDLYAAIESQDEIEVDKIISQYDNRCDPNRLVMGLDMSLLHLAVGLSDNSPRIVKTLLQHGGNPNNTICGEGVSPLHLSVMYDYDKVLEVLMSYGGDPRILTKEGKSCFDIVKKNVETEMEERCFTYFYNRSVDFRQSLSSKHAMYSSESLCNESDIEGFYSCDDSEILYDIPPVKKIAPVLNASQINGNFSYLMTDDESNGLSTDSSCSRDKLTTIPEETEVGSKEFSGNTHKGGNDSTFSCANSTPPAPTSPSKDDIQRLQLAMQKLNIPVTSTTYPVLSKYAQSESKLLLLSTPKSSTSNFSNELQAALTDLNLIYEWGKLKIDFIQNATPTKRTSKSFFNYVLLDPKIIKRANFSGNHLKSDIIKNVEKYEKFLTAVFYIGKGCGKRPLQHLVEAKAKLIASKSSKVKSEEKVDKILEIWKSGQGVMVLSTFHHSSEREANVYEASMIDAVGLIELSNLKKGSYAGTAATKWSQKAKNQFGSFLLYKCFCAFAVSDHRSFQPHDV